MNIFGSGKGEDAEMPFFGHLEALRPRLIRSAIVVAVLACAAFACKNLLMAVLTGPELPTFPTNRLFAWLADALSSDTLRINSRPVMLINTTMAGQFNLHLSLSLYTALILSVPYIMWELWGFVRPALTERERKAGRMFVFNVSLCFFVGVLFGYFVIAPLAVNFLAGYTVSTSISNMIDVSSYLSMVLNIVFAGGVVFLLPVAVDILARAGVVTAAFMRRFRRHAIVVLAVLSALITPPDAASMVLVLLPLYGLYALSIRIAARYENK